MEGEEEGETKVYSAEMVNLHVHMTYILLMQATVAKGEANCVVQWEYSSRIDMLSPGET